MFPAVNGFPHWQHAAPAVPAKRSEFLQGQAPGALPGSDILFVTWIAFGDYGDGGLKTHNFHSVDMR